MTFDNAGWAIDGATMTSALARRASFAVGGKNGGIVLRDDLKVTPLDTPGVGVQIAPGVGLVLNGYQGASPNEVYTVSNPSVHTVTSDLMPASNPSAKSYILAIVVGDPAFSQVGHPWMPSGGVPAGTESTFQYVRPTIIEVAAGATTLPSGYPALPLARLDVPANTTTITSGMIVDLRKLALPRSTQDLYISPNAGFSNVYMPQGSVPGDWGATFQPSIAIPSWAKRCLIVTQVDGFYVGDASSNVYGLMLINLGGLQSNYSTIDLPTSAGAVRGSVMGAANLDVSSIAGQTKTLKIMGYQSSPVGATNAKKLSLQAGTTIVHDVRFFEV